MRRGKEIYNKWTSSTKDINRAIPFYLYKAKYLNTLTKGGAKVLSEYMLNDIFYGLKKTRRLQPLYVFSGAIMNVRPSIFLRPCKMGGVTYYLALVIYTEKKWILYTAR